MATDRLVNIYEFSDYKDFFKSWVDGQANGGHGEYRRLALALNVSTTMVSQVFRGDKNLSLEMACDLAEYLNLSDDESEYLLLLVEFAKAGSHKLQNKFLHQIQRRREEHRKLEKIMKNDVTLSEEARATFYSTWIYSGIRLLTDIEGFNDAATIADRLNLPRNEVAKILEFLLKHRLVVKKGGHLRMGPARTHVGASSPMVSRHHFNWRFRAIEKMQYKREDDLYFSAPMSMSANVANAIRQRLPKMIQEITDEVSPSESQVVRCLNIDWFEY